MFRNLPRIATVLGAIVLSFALVAAPKGPRADAFVNPVPILIGGAIEAAPAEGLLLGGSMVTVGAVGLGVVGIGLLAYATRDTWMPLVSGLLNRDWTTSDSPTSGGSCQTTNSFTRSGNQVIQSTNSVPASCGLSFSIPIKYICMAPGGVPQVFTSSSAHGRGETVPKVSGFNCGSGLVPIYAETVGAVATWAVDNADWLQTTNMTCRDAAGGTHVLTDSERGHPDRVTFPSCVDHGWLPDSVTVTTPYGTGLTADFPNESWASNYGDCFSGAELICTTRVVVNEENCTDEPTPAHCANWYNYRTSHPELVRCKFGSHVVQMRNCDPLRYAYQGDAPHTVTDPDWGTDPDPAPDPDPNPDPDPSPSPSAGTDTFPSVGANPTGPVVTPTGSTDPDTQTCFGSGWSWNPVSWVYVPVKCALLWAFVPDPAVMQGVFTDVTDAWTATLPGAWVDAVGNLSVPSSPGSSCAGPHVAADFGHGIGFDTYPLSACSGPAATLATLSRVGLSCFFAYFGGMACLRALGSGFNWSPGGSSS